MSGLQTQANGGSLQLSTLATINTLAASIFPSQGNIYFVNPEFGNDVANDGSRNAPLQTLARALALATAGQNDIIFLCATSNTAANTTDYQTQTLNWNKDLVHLIGVNAGSQFGQRSRIAFDSAFTGAGNLFTLSANGCLIANIEFFMGVASVNPIGCMSISGQRNHLSKCQIAGMGNAANDISGSYSLQLNGAQENLIEDCVIGQDTVQLGAGTSNSVILFSNNAGTGCTRNTFRKCQIMLDTSSATACLFLRSGATAMDRVNRFDDCVFINAVSSGSTALTHAMAITTGTSPAGMIVLSGTTGLVGASGWNTTASGNVFAVGGPQPTNTTWGLDVAVTS
jgi:hypothetical protein